MKWLNNSGLLLFLRPPELIPTKIFCFWDVDLNDLILQKIKTIFNVFVYNCFVCSFL